MGKFDNDPFTWPFNEDYWVWGIWRFWPGFLDQRSDTYKQREQQLAGFIVSNWKTPVGNTGV
jgi:hypothetical protein